ncbi:MAG: mercury methylation ferredoxin HgcB [Desulfobulbaceae bacterium]|nr:mercury methylation ferredoxin HgcB [Desulfobulbaceae bacterium]HIJ78503.1 4Fe-4S binding protein [Deltaproteobacteria bacterium]
MADFVYLPEVVTLELDQLRCVGCGMCLEVCPHAVFRLNGRKAEIVRRDACMECGACATNCSVTAIKVQAGVGCAQAIFNQLLGKSKNNCC